MEVDVSGERFEVEIWFWFMSLMEVGHFKSKRVDGNANTYVQSKPGIFHDLDFQKLWIKISIMLRNNRRDVPNFHIDKIEL